MSLSVQLRLNRGGSDSQKGRRSMTAGEIEMGNPSRRDSAAKKVVAAARSIVTYQMGLPEGCRRMHNALWRLAPYETGLPTVFEGYLKEVRLLPTGSERLMWNRKVLQEKDIALEAANQRFRNQVFDSCWALIERFAEPSPPCNPPATSK